MPLKLFLHKFLIMYQYREQLPVTGLILAGGKAQHLGEHGKGLIEASSQSMIRNILNCLRKQIKNNIICTNGNLGSYAEFGVPVITDESPDFQGPLAGISAGMQHAEDPWLLVTPCDTPFIPDDLAVRLYYALRRSGADIAVVHDGDRAHYLHAMMRTSLKQDLDKNLNANKLSVHRWYSEQRLLEVDFSDKRDAFVSIDILEDL